MINNHYNKHNNSVKWCFRKSNVCGNNFYLSVNSESYEKTHYENISLPVIVHEKIGDKNVKTFFKAASVKFLADYKDVLIKRLIIPEGYTEIDRLFYIYPGAEISRNFIINNIELPQSLKIIRSNTFTESNGIKFIHIPEGVIKIEDQAFSRSGIENIDMDDNITEIPYGMCEESISLKYVKLPGNCKYIGKYAFADCNLKEVKIPDNCLYIAYDAFRRCPITKLIISRSCKYISGFAETKIESVIIPDGCKVIGREAFAYCYNLKKIIIPRSVTKIEDFFDKWNIDTGTYYRIQNRVMPITTTIYGYTNTVAFRYALKYGNTFVDLETGKITLGYEYYKSNNSRIIFW